MEPPVPRQRRSGEGFRQTQNQLKGSKFTSDSNSSSNGVTDLTLDLGRRSSRHTAGNQIKHLLAKEMSKECKSRTRSKSVIARLMGLEGLPPPQLAPKPQKRLPNKQHVTSHVDKAERTTPFASHRSSRKSSKEEQEFKDVFEVVSTRIVVLKPNLGKVNRFIRCHSPPPSRSPLSDGSSLEEFPCLRSKAERGRREKLNSNIDMKLQFKGSQGIARKITTKMENKSDYGSPNIIPLKMSEYYGESSSTVSMNDSTNESDITILTSAKSPGFNSQCKLASCRGESSVAGEAKRRLLRRWKIAHKSKDRTELNRGGTLAHMLDMPVLDARCSNGNRIGPKGFVASDLSDDLGEPLGISSRDGCKDDCVNNFLRPRSAASSTNLSGSPRANAGCEAPRNCNYKIPREAKRWDNNKKIVSHADLRDALAHRKLRSRESKHHSDHFIRGETSCASKECHLRKNKQKASVMEMDPLRRSPLVSEASTDHAHEYLQLEHLNVSSSPETLCPKLPNPFLCSSSDGREVSKEHSEQSSKGIPGPLHHHVPELQSPASSSEADQPSPVSTLEAPFTDDLSFGSMCFENLSADLHGTFRNGEGKAIFFCDDDIGEGPCNSLEYGATHKTEGYKKVNKGTLDNVLINESVWLNLGEDIDAIVKDIEKLLAGELVAELVEELL